MGIYQEIDILNSIRGVLSFDLETKMMPPEGLQYRGKQLGMITNLVHKKMNSDTFQVLVKQLHGSELDGIKKRNVELLHRSLVTATSVPSELVQNISTQANTTNQTWKNAKKKRDFKLVSKDVEKLFDLTVKRAQILADTKGYNSPQSALLSERDPGFNVNNLTKIFSETKSYLIPILKKIGKRHGEFDISFLNNEYPRETKVKLSETIADLYQYDYKSKNATGRIGEVEHPLTMRLGPKDVRITVNYDEYLGMMSATQHELGHGLHGLNKKIEWIGTPINGYNAPSVSEMTSRYTENKIGKSKEFWDAYYPTLQKITGLKVDKETFYQGFTHIEPGTLRMGADEVSYGIHIIIRFEIEKDLFNERISFSEIPSVWSEKYNNYLGVEVKDDTAGPLQDLHWYSYYWCYFQGYALGDLLGSQVYYHMESIIPEWKEDLSKGDMTIINNYLKKNVYELGALYDPLDMIKEITGNSFDSKYLRIYLENKYLK